MPPASERRPRRGTDPHDVAFREVQRLYAKAGEALGVLTVTQIQSTFSVAFRRALEDRDYEKVMEECEKSVAMLDEMIKEHASAEDNRRMHGRWTVTGPLLSPGPKGWFDEVAVKDPSLVYFKGKYHVFYTSKPRKGKSPHQTSLGYVSAPALEDLHKAPRVKLKDVVGDDVIAVQVFYFEPQGLWYLVGHVSLGKPHLLQPVYLTNPDIENVDGWSKPKPLLGERAGSNPFWIDFWVICDQKKAHLFYTDHIDSMFRIETALDDFPEGFKKGKEQLAVSAQGADNMGRWHLHEASHIYRVKKDGRYLALLEGAYAHPTRRNYWDSRNRFMFAMVADRLEGPWERIEDKENQFLADAPQLLKPDGTRPALHQVSHPELIRSGYNQRLEIDDYRFKIVFQAFDASNTPDNFDYDLLPWALWLGRNY